MEREEIYQEAKNVANKAMSLEDRIAAQHGSTFWMQQKPEMELEEVVGIFKQAFAEKRAELAEEEEEE